MTSSDASTERRAITSRAAIVAAGTLTSRLLGLVREQVLAGLFSRAATDVFFVAFLIPNVLRQLFAEGAVQNGVLPVLSQVKAQQGETRAREFFRALRGLSLLLLALVCALGIWGAPFLVELFAGGFKQYPGKFERTVAITRWVFPYIFFMGTAALGVAALNTYRRFVVTSFAPALLNVAFIVAALLLPTWFQASGYDPLMALVAGVLLGGVLQVVAQWPSLSRIGYLETPRLDQSDAAVREVLRRMAPVLFGFGVYYVDVVVARHLLSELEQGAPSYFTFAQRLCDFPQGIFVMAVQSATLPALATLAAERNDEELGKTFAHGLRLALFVAIPSTLLLCALSEPVVSLIYERGHFDRHAAIETGRSLFAQAAGIWLVAAVRQLVIVFYAIGDTRSPVYVSFLDFLVFAALAWILRDRMGHVGVAWAVSAASGVQVALLAVQLHRKVPRLDWAAIARGTSKILLAAIPATLAAVWLARQFPITPLSSAFERALPALMGTLGFAAAYLLAAWGLRCEELRLVLGPLLRRFRQKRP